MTRLRPVLIVFVLLALMSFVYQLGGVSIDPLAESTLALGFVLLFAFSLGQMALALKAPSITGFLVAGILAGPFVLGFVTDKSAEPLQLVNGLALSLIAFTAGGELKISRFMPRMKTLLWTAALQFGYTFFAVFSALFPLFYFTDLLGGSLIVAFCGAVLISALSTANSPATAIAVITETRSSGPVSDLVIGVTVLKDVIVVVVFGMVIGLIEAVIGQGEGMGFGLALDMFYEITISLLIGWAAGALMTGYLKLTDQNIGLFVVTTALIVVEVSVALHASVLLISMMAGFIVENYSETGEKLIKGIETSSAPIYVIFFSLAGQGLDLNAVAQMWPYALILVLARMAGVRQGTVYGVKKAGEPSGEGRHAWTGFVGQAGVSIGFALTIGAQFPGWGQKLATLALAGIAINQIIGPIMMKRSLILAGEASPEPAEEKAAR